MESESHRAESTIDSEDMEIAAGVKMVTGSGVVMCDRESASMGSWLDNMTVRVDLLASRYGNLPSQTSSPSVVSVNNRGILHLAHLSSATEAILDPNHDSRHPGCVVKSTLETFRKAKSLGDVMPCIIRAGMLELLIMSVEIVNHPTDHPRSGDIASTPGDNLFDVLKRLASAPENVCGVTQETLDNFVENLERSFSEAIASPALTTLIVNTPAAHQPLNDCVLALKMMTTVCGEHKQSLSKLHAASLRLVSELAGKP
jgi:hypothetical protein